MLFRTKSFPNHGKVLRVDVVAHGRLSDPPSTVCLLYCLKISSVVCSVVCGVQRRL